MRSIRTIALVALPAIAALSFAAPAAADVKAGVDAWQAGDYQQAVAEWRPLAIAGDPDAQFNLGQAYKLGRGVPADLAQAETWYRRAARQGHLQAEDNLGLVLFTANHRDEAMPYIIASAERGEPRAQYVLGTAMYNGDLAAKDWPRAYALTKRASDAGLQIASARLAQLDQLIPLEQRQHGLAMIPDMEKSEQRARLAAVNAAAPPPPAPAPSPIRTASLPASAPAVTYTPPPVIAPAPVKPLAAPTPAPSSPAAAAAANAAAEATAAAKAAVAAPTPVKLAQAAPSQPGTSYAPPPASGTLPPKADPAPSTPATTESVRAAPKAASPAPAPTTAHAAASPWRAQLGAFGVVANAQNLWASLGKTYPAVAARQPYLVKTGKLTRLQVGDFADKAEAEAFCATVRKGDRPCMVVNR